MWSKENIVLVRRQLVRIDFERDIADATNMTTVVRLTRELEKLERLWDISDSF